MATKAPGIYFHEIDNTHFENPKATTSGTVLAVVGYANKGPIGVPTVITDWNNFLNTFGKPVEGLYSGLAVYMFLTAGGTVLFERVAEKTLAGPSAFIMKNGTLKATDGYIAFSRTNNYIEADEYKENDIFAFDVTNLDAKKTFYVETPPTGERLEKKDAVLQINNQINATPAKYEGEIKELPVDQVVGFNIEDESQKINENDYYVYSNSNMPKNNFIQSIKKRVDNGSNATVEIEISKNAALLDSNYWKESENIGEFFKTDKKFKLVRNDVAHDILLKFSDYKEELTFKDITKVFDDALNDYNIKTFLDVEPETNAKLVFVSFNDNDDFDIKSNDEIIEEKEDHKYVDIFVRKNGSSPSEGLENFAESPETEDGSTPYFFYVTKYKAKATRLVDASEKIYIEDFDENKNRIVISTKETGKLKKVKLSETITYNKQNLKNIINPLKEYIMDGQDEIEGLSIKIVDNKIRFINSGIEAPKISKYPVEDTNFQDFLLLTKNDEITNPGYDDPVNGKPRIPDESKDMIGFFSKEEGEGTNNITIKVWSSKNDLLENSKRVYGIDVFVNDIRKETFDNICLDFDDVDHRFDTVINESVENGGSSYISVIIEKKDWADPKVQLKEGKFKIGKPNGERNIEKPSSIPYESWGSYDYAKGSNGIPKEGGSGLFEEAMDPKKSALSNKDLYNFHILVAPDNISQEVQAACIKLCEERGDAIALIDPPVGLNKEDVINWHNGRGSGRNVLLNSNYAAVYWPWCKVVDNSLDFSKYAWVMPSIVMAAQYVNVDKTSGAQSAPAGEANGRLSVIDIEQYPNPLDRDELYVDYNRINPIIKFNDGSIIAYGEKTTQRENSILTKIHVRRMLIQIKKSCRNALRRFMFMPNTADCLGKVGNTISSILEGYKTRGGINFYKVICDETNNPIELRQQDIINVDAVIVPEGTIEQINISLTLNKSEETITE